MRLFSDVDAPWGPESMKFPVNSLLAGNSAFRDGFARDCLLQRRVLCEPLFNARQTGLDKQQAVQEKLALLACYREGINAHLTAAIAIAEERPGGLLMPNQSLLYTGRVLACSDFPGPSRGALESASPRLVHRNTSS